MTPSQVASDPHHLSLACDASHERLTTVLRDLPGGHGVVAMFVGFITAARLAEVDAGRAFEELLSVFEARQQATHRGSAASN